MAKVSIIIPIYNVEKYVHKTIDSVINQTEKDIEIILVDDGSTDGSGKICDEYALKDERIRVIHKTNGGLSSARNAGIKVASSDYIMLLDGDDFLNAHAVSILNETMEKYPSDFIQFHYQEVRENDNDLIEDHNEQVYQAHSLQEMYSNLYRAGGEFASACTKMYRKDVIKKVLFKNIRHEDEMWCTDAFRNGMTVTYIPNVLYYYVMRDNSIIHADFNEKKLEIFDVYDHRINILKKLQYDDLLSIAYQRMFITIIALYCEAKISKNQKSMKEIFFYFKNNKNNIKKYANLSLKFKIIFNLMYFNFNFICIYILYNNLRREE